MQLTRKKLIILAIAAALLFVVMVFLILEFNKAKLRIVTEEGGVIYVSREQGGELTEIGTTEATYSSSQPGLVFVQVVKNDQSTYTSESIETRSTKDLSVELKDTKDLKKLGPGKLSYIYIDEGYVYGINNETRSLTYESIGSKAKPQNTFLFYPFTNKAAWNDPNNLFFTTFGEGVHQVVNGNRIERITTGAHDSIKAYDFTKFGDRPAVLITDDGLYRTNHFIKGPSTLIYPFNYGGDSELFSDESQIYFVHYRFEDAVVEGDTAEIASTTLNVLNYKGDILSKFNLNVARKINKVIHIPELKAYAILSNDDFIFIDEDSGELREIPYYFSDAKDLVYYKNRLLILSTDGLYQYNVKQNTYYRIAEFPKSEIYTPNSLTVQNKKLYFTTDLNTEKVSEDPNYQSSSGTYKVEL